MPLRGSDIWQSLTDLLGVSSNRGIGCDYLHEPEIDG